MYPVSFLPARVIKKRFDDETIKTLLNSKWWLREVTWIKKNIHLFDRVLEKEMLENLEDE